MTRLELEASISDVTGLASVGADLTIALTGGSMPGCFIFIGTVCQCGKSNTLRNGGLIEASAGSFAVRIGPPGTEKPNFAWETGQISSFNDVSKCT